MRLGEGAKGQWAPYPLPQTPTPNPLRGFHLVPKLLLGDAYKPQFPLGNRNVPAGITGFLTKQTFALKGVPQRELGNRKKSWF